MQYERVLQLPHLAPALRFEDWDMETEMAWTWFWDRIQGMLMDLKTPPLAE